MKEAAGPNSDQEVDSGTGALRTTTSWRSLTDSGPTSEVSAAGVRRRLILLYVQASAVAVAITLFLIFCGLEFTGRQWVILAGCVTLGVPAYVIPDILAINRLSRPLTRALNCLDQGQQRDPILLSDGLVTALNLPYLSFLRISLLHGPVATIMVLAVMLGANQIFDAGYLPWQLTFVAFSILFFASPAHAIYEYFALTRGLVPVVDRLWACAGQVEWNWRDRVKSIQLRSKLLYLSIFMSAIPLAFLAWSTVFKAELEMERRGVAGGFSDILPIVFWAAALVAVSISMVWVIAIQLSRDVTQGAEDLSTAMRHVREGRLDIELRVAGTDEYAALFLGFNHMTAELRDEMKIHAITHELAGVMDLDTLIARIMSAATDLLDAERSTLFIYDEHTDELWSRFAEGVDTHEIRFAADSGVAGNVFRTGQIANIRNPYSDPRFNAAIDKATGFETTSILCVPIIHKRGTRIGVTQVLNKRGGHFGAADEARLRSFAAQISASLENARLFEDVNEMKNYNESILRSTSDGIITLDQDGDIVTLNDAAEIVLRCREVDIVGRNAHEFFQGDNYWVMRSVGRVGEKGTPDLVLDVDLVFDEETRSVNLRTTPLVDPQGASLGFLLAFEDVTREKRLKTSMSRYLPKEIADQLLQSGSEALTGRDQKLSILFSDIRKFTSLSEELGARATVTMLNEYFERMVEVIHEHGGILDKFIGDAIMALFGAPFEGEKDADHAIETANRMHAELKALNVERVARGSSPINIGVGVCTGEVIAGNIGSSKRFDYTAIGDHVNIASRLEGATKHYGVDILVSEFTVEALQDRHLLREIDTIRVQGKNRPVRVFEALGHRDEAQEPDLHQFLERYGAAQKALSRREWSEAITAFEHALALKPEDKPSLIHLERCRSYRDSPPSPDWDGVWEMATK